MARFSVRTLGFPEIRRDDRLCPLALRKGLALLVYLAEAKGSVGRDVVATMLWPESPEEVVRARLRRLLHRLQLTLGDVLTTDRSTVRWSSAIDLQVDFSSSSRLATAASSSGPAASIWPTFSRASRPATARNSTSGLSFAVRPCGAARSRRSSAWCKRRNAAGDYAAAAAHAGRLVALDPLSEVYARHLIRNLLLAGDRAAAERHLKALTQRLRDELDVAPEAETRALEAGATCRRRRRRHDTSAVAASISPSRPTAPGAWIFCCCPASCPTSNGSGRSAGAGRSCPRSPEMGRLILLDRRGVGLSDRVGFSPSVEATAQDIGTVLDAAGSRRVVLFGASEGGPACIKFAADHPDRVAGLILFASLAKGSAAPDYPHALQAGQYDVWLQQLVAAWGGPAGIETFAPSLAGDPQARAWWAGLLRAASSPGAIKGVLEALRDTDVRHLLERISVPTLVLHRRGDRAVRIGAGRHLASHIAQARFIELDGADHWVFAGDQQPVLGQHQAIRRRSCEVILRSK